MKCIHFLNLYQKQSGNALFLILIVIGLFAALSYAVTQSGRSGGSVDRETAELTAAQIAQYFGSIEQAFKRLRVLGCAENQLTVENDVYVGGCAGTWAGGQVMLPIGTNTNSPSDGSCSIFDSNGGGVSPVVYKGAIVQPYTTSSCGSSAHSVWWGWPAPGNTLFITQAVPGIGTSAPDVVASLHYVPETVCRAFGKGVGHPTPVLKSEMGDWTDPPQFSDGTYPNTYGAGWGAGMPSGMHAWCLDGQDSGTAGRTWHIYYVVYAR